MQWLWPLSSGQWALFSFPGDTVEQRPVIWQVPLEIIYIILRLITMMPPTHTTTKCDCIYLRLSVVGSLVSRKDLCVQYLHHSLSLPLVFCWKLIHLTAENGSKKWVGFPSLFSVNMTLSSSESCSSFPFCLLEFSRLSNGRSLVLALISHWFLLTSSDAWGDAPLV